MPRFIGAPNPCAPWGLWIFYNDGRNYETACRFDHEQQALAYAREGLRRFPEVSRFALLRRRPGARIRVRYVSRETATGGELRSGT